MTSFDTCFWKFSVATGLNTDSSESNSLIGINPEEGNNGCTSMLVADLMMSDVGYTVRLAKEMWTGHRKQG